MDWQILGMADADFFEVVRRIALAGVLQSRRDHEPRPPVAGPLELVHVW